MKIHPPKVIRRVNWIHVWRQAWLVSLLFVHHGSQRIGPVLRLYERSRMSHENLDVFRISILNVIS